MMMDLVNCRWLTSGHGEQTGRWIGHLLIVSAPAAITPRSPQSQRDVGHSDRVGVVRNQPQKQHAVDAKVAVDELTNQSVGHLVLGVLDIGGRWLRQRGGAGLHGRVVMATDVAPDKANAIQRHDRTQQPNREAVKHAATPVVVSYLNLSV